MINPSELAEGNFRRRQAHVMPQYWLGHNVLMNPVKVAPRRKMPSGSWLAGGSAALKIKHD